MLCGVVVVLVSECLWGVGWVFLLVGFHFLFVDYHAPFEGRTYLRTTFIESLLGERGEIVTVTAGPMAGEKVLPKDIGIGFPAIIESNPIEDYWVSTAVDSVNEDGMGMGSSGRSSRGFDGGLAEDGLDLRKYRFVIQFVWQPKSPGVVEFVPDDGNRNDY